MPGWLPARSVPQPAWEPAHAGLDAGLLGAPAGMGASPCRAGCHCSRGLDRHASQFMPAPMPGRPSTSLLRAPSQLFSQLIPARMPGCSEPWPAWQPAHVGWDAGPVRLPCHLPVQRVLCPEEYLRPSTYLWTKQLAKLKTSINASSSSPKISQSHQPNHLIFGGLKEKSKICIFTKLFLISLSFT